jgi:hypothetical protein
MLEMFESFCPIGCLIADNVYLFRFCHKKLNFTNYLQKWMGRTVVGLIGYLCIVYAGVLWRAMFAQQSELVFKMWLKPVGPATNLEW